MNREEERREWMAYDGLRWAATILWAYPTPSELGIHAVKLDCLSEERRARLGYVELVGFRASEDAALNEALESSMEGQGVG